MSETWKRACLESNKSMRDAMQLIEDTPEHIAIVVDESYKLLGVVTDGDVRRAILAGKELQCPVHEIMTKTPAYVEEGTSISVIQELMADKGIRVVPVLRDGVIVELHGAKIVARPDALPNPVVLMAGGLGSRLGSLTKNTPKPMLKVGNRPILETILLQFVERGFSNFYISTNYKAEIIEEYFGSGEKWGISIQYLRETKRLGTAGALSLMQEKPEHPFFLMNGDILTTVDFNALLDFHTSENSVATMCVREYEHTVPFGVIRNEEHKLTGLEEKPTVSMFVNAGIYVLNPEILDYIPEDTFYNITDVFENLVEEDAHASIFPLREYWMDIGRRDDFEQAQSDFSENFE